MTHSEEVAYPQCQVVTQSEWRSLWGSPASLGGMVTMCEWPDLKLSEVAVALSGFVGHVLTCFCGCDLRWRGDSGPMENYTFLSPEATLRAQIQRCTSGGAFTHVKARTPCPDGNHIPPTPPLDNQGVSICDNGNFACV